ncbi:tetratricopeptide repeat protein [Nonomuraea sp. K274]|uniref:Tetratricopeptide repeat protein n=1 Tax=Nonomuraea cypriaca TaxID=1187855 RepID=A0A931EXT3_9ACTN|nr:LuxR C-terminal-related transcriptional regulator [Nonomuraea cypriaca]MBF8186590.1 tetratricopeptide repeat protein [Nonomuraea cypriaca]
MLRPADFRNLPAEPNMFVGRESDMDELVHLMTVSRAVTLCGAGGIGKTRLALRLAARIAPDHPGGVYLVELADLEKGELGGHVAAELGIAGDLAETIGGRRVLLLLDNCEQVIGECAELCRALLGRCPGLTILATSREPLRVEGETVWRVPPLSVDGAESEAVRLFVARAAAARPGFEPTEETRPLVVELCQALDGLPLAIELAAAMVRVLSVGQLVERLDDRFRLLAGGARTAPARHRTLRATVDWSYRLLTSQERLLLRRTAAFRSSWTLDLAEEVCSGPGLPEEEVLPRLCDLVDKSLVALDGEIAGQARYRLLETVRDYALEQLAASGEEPELRCRHLEALARMAAGFREALAPGTRTSWRVFERYINLFDGLRAEIGAACDWSVSIGLPETALGLLTDIRFLLIGGRKPDMAERLDRLLALDAPLVPPGLRGQAMILRGELAQEAGDLEPAVRCVRTGLDMCTAAGDVYGEAIGTIALAGLTGEQDLLSDALDTARRSGDLILEALAQGSRASFGLSQGRLHEARRAFEAVLSISEELDNHYGQAFSHIGLATIARRTGDLPTARRHYESGLRLVRHADPRQQIASCLAGLGGVALDEGDLVEARAKLTKALLLSRDAGLRTGIARRLEAWASLLAAEGDHRHAVLLTAASVALRHRRPDARTEELLRPARSRLGEAVVAVLWSEGTSMTADQAVSCALDGTLPDLPPQPTPTLPATQESRLTPREREIAELVARGLSNRAIADELIISPATAARHVANILSKLGFSTRTQIAAWLIANR